MVDKHRVKLALGLLVGSVRRLDEDQMVALDIPHEGVEFMDFAEGDFTWRSTVSSGPAKGQPVQFHPDVVRNAVVAVLVEAFERVGAFKRMTRKK